MNWYKDRRAIELVASGRVTRPVNGRCIVFADGDRYDVTITANGWRCACNGRRRCVHERAATLEQHRWKNQQQRTRKPRTGTF